MHDSPPYVHPGAPLGSLARASADGGAYAYYLGLKRHPDMRFDMQVYDSRFLFNATLVAKVGNIGGTGDLEAGVFRLHDNSTVASIQCRLCREALDTRTLTLTVDPTDWTLVTKFGYTTWPDTPPPTTHAIYPGGPREMTWHMGGCGPANTSCWIRGVSKSAADLIELVKTLKVSEH